MNAIHGAKFLYPFYDPVYFSNKLYAFITNKSSINKSVDATPHGNGWFTKNHDAIIQPLSAQAECAILLGDFDFVRLIHTHRVYHFQNSEWLCTQRDARCREGTDDFFFNLCPAECIDSSCQQRMHVRWNLSSVSPYAYQPSLRSYMRGLRFVGDFSGVGARGNAHVVNADPGVPYDGF